MDEFRGVIVRTPLGPASFGARPSTRVGAGLVIVALCGLGRGSAAFRPVLADLERLAPVVISEMPGHGAAPAAPTPDLQTLASRYAMALAALLPNRPLVLFGESLGGLVALSLAKSAAAGVAVEPPLRPARAWRLHELWRQGRLASLPPDLLTGIMGLGAPKFPDHTCLLRELGPYVEVLAGSELPGLPRLVDAGPSMLSPEDRQAVVAAGAVLTVAQGGHTLLTENPDACLAAVARAIEAARSQQAQCRYGSPAA